MPRLVKVAVVGSGLAGLTAAYLLSQATSVEDIEFEVHLFEKEASLGMDSSSVSLPTPDGKGEWRVDVPMRSFQGGYYPQLISLYKHLGVAFRQADFSYSFCLLSPSTATQSRRITTNMIYNGASGRAGVSMPSYMDEPYVRTQGQPQLTRIVAKVSVLSCFIFTVFQVAVNYIRLIWISVPFLRPKEIASMTFREWSEYSVPRNLISQWTGFDRSWTVFASQILIPLFSAVCTTTEKDVMQHPVEEFLDYIWLTFGTHHYVVVDGVRDVVARLTSSIPNIHLSSQISSLCLSEISPNQLSIRCASSTGDKMYTNFDHIIFATQACSAVPLLSSYLSSLPLKSKQRCKVEDQIRCLQTFKYRPTIVINHTDHTLQPDCSRDRRDLSLIVINPSYQSTVEQEPDPQCVPSSYTMATHVLPLPRSDPRNLPQVYQTTNPIISPREETILSVARLQRAVVTQESKIALKGLYQEKRRWWQCAGHGITALGPLQGAGKMENSKGGDAPGIWICGSYAHAGIPLLEGCVVSARNVVEQGIFRSEGVRIRCKPW